MKRAYILCYMITTFMVQLLQLAKSQNTSPYWSLAGNSNATATSKFGTTSSVGLQFYTNNVSRIAIGSTGNVGIGTTAPIQKLDVKGNINLAKGFRLYVENRPVLRIDSLLWGTYLGNSAGFLTAGRANAAFGYYALSKNNAGHYNTALGAFALSLNTSGNNNVAVGLNALYNNSASDNTAVGTNTLLLNTQGINNVAVGNNALENNVSGTHNTAAGRYALRHNTIGTLNTALGFYALIQNTQGSQNTAIGVDALGYTQNSTGNVAVGYRSGFYYNQGWNNTFVGAGADGTYGGIYNSVAIGNGALVNAPNQVRLGNAYTTSIGGYANWTNISDGRVKKNIQTNIPGLAFINKLKPVSYNLDLDAADKITAARTAGNGADESTSQLVAPFESGARKEKQQVVYTGFIAQDVEQAAKELEYNFSGVDVAKSEHDLYGLRYTDFIMPIVKAVQELSQQNDSIRTENKKQQEQINELLQLLKIKQPGTVVLPETVESYLQQNFPNPLKNLTSISYKLPVNCKLAHLLITDGGGKQVQIVSLDQSGMVKINATSFISGIYNYSLIINGKILDTKRMSVVR